MVRTRALFTKFSVWAVHTVRPKSLDPFYIVTYYRRGLDFLDIQYWLSDGHIGLEWNFSIHAWTNVWTVYCVCITCWEWTELEPIAICILWVLQTDNNVTMPINEALPHNDVQSVPPPMFLKSNMYCKSKKSWPIILNKFLYQMG